MVFFGVSELKVISDLLSTVSLVDLIGQMEEGNLRPIYLEPRTVLIVMPILHCLSSYTSNRLSIHLIYYFYHRKVNKIEKEGQISMHTENSRLRRIPANFHNGLFRLSDVGGGRNFCIFRVHQLVGVPSNIHRTYRYILFLF